MRAIVTSRRPLLYDEGPDAALDRPAHVRAASAVARLGDTLVVVQDDAHWLAVVRADQVRAVALPEGPGGLRLFQPGRKNKQHKLDLEAALVLGAAVVALGSGSTGARERAVVQPWPVEAGPPRLVPLPGLYDALRAAVPDAELNIEGAFAIGSTLRLLQRGNGAGAVNATLDLPLAWLERALAGSVEALAVTARRWDLGGIGEDPLTFTDGAADPGDEDGWWFLAAAERSPNTYDDGEVTGSALGRVLGDELVVAILEDERGEPVVVKAEGMALGDRPGHVHVVVDADDPDRPAELLDVWVRA